MWRKEGVGAMVMPAASRAAWNSGSAHSSVMMAIEVSPSMDPACGRGSSSRRRACRRPPGKPYCTGSWRSRARGATPQPAASSGLRPVKYRRGSQPKMERMAVSLPGEAPWAPCARCPACRPRARASMAGVSTASRGVFPAQFRHGIVRHAVADHKKILHKNTSFPKICANVPGIE